MVAFPHVRSSAECATRCVRSMHGSTPTSCRKGAPPAAALQTCGGPRGAYCCSGQRLSSEHKNDHKHSWGRKQRNQGRAGAVTWSARSAGRERWIPLNGCTLKLLLLPLIMPR